MKLRNIFGTDIKESLKKIRYNYKNKNFKPYIVDRTLYKTDFKFYVANVDGESWYVDSTKDAVAKKEDWLWPEMGFVKSLCKEGDVVLECGGHHGLTAVVISKWIGESGHLYSFEPNPDNLTIIHKNLDINAIKNVTVIPNAVGAADGTILISHSSSNSYILKGKEHNGIEVAVVKADDFIHLKPTILKIDVEGFEQEVLAGASEILKTMPKLAIELHPDMMARYGSSVEELLSLIDERYDLWIQLDIYKPPVPYDRKKTITERGHLFGVPKK